jgi:5-methylcytosine-specific restriction endonuclease McrA
MSTEKRPKKRKEPKEPALIANEESLRKSISSDESLQDVPSATGNQGPKRKNLKKFLIPVLRRATYRWPARSDALKDSRKERNSYECAMCKDRFKNNEVVLDHIVPVVDPKLGFTNWDDYINRMFPEKEGFQVLCNDCHDIKTELEDEMRKHFSKERKKNEK